MISNNTSTAIGLGFLIVIVLFMIYNSMYMNSNRTEQNYIENMHSSLRNNHNTEHKIQRNDNGLHPELAQAMHNQQYNESTSKQENATSKRNTNGMSDDPENGIVKFCVYHMQGCGHCRDVMEVTGANGKTTFQTVKDAFNGDDRVQVMDFKIGRDKEASKYNAFPVIMLITGSGEVEYNRQRTAEGMIGFIRSHL